MSETTPERGVVPNLSIVIPAFNEASRIGASLKEIVRFLNSRDLAAEVIVIDDGSRDGTEDVALSYAESGVRIVRNDVNKGKGYSVRRGFQEARGTWVLLSDADLSTPISEVDRLLALAHTGPDIVIGSRALDRTRTIVHQPRFRKIGGIVFNWVVRSVLNLPIKDTQCGFKLFHRARSARVFDLQSIRGFGFDAEILFIAKMLGLKIAETPVSWSHAGGSKVRVLSDGLYMLANLVQIRWNQLRGRYR